MTLKRLRTIPFAVALAAVARASAGEFPFFPPIDPPRTVQVVARGGPRDLAAEDPAAALKHATDDGIEWVEVGVRLTPDGRHALARDGGSKSAEPGAFSLGEALALAKGKVNLSLDCRKVDPARLVREVTEAGMERQVVVSADVDVLRAVRAATGGDRLALMPRWATADGPDAFGDLGPAAVRLDPRDVTPDRCRAFHDRGLKVRAEALGGDDRPEVWDRLADAGVDWVRSDRPEEVLAHAVLRRVGPARVKVAHHRGASRYAPENTLPAYEKAIRLGADFVEFDIRTSRDGGFFLLHDGRLDRTTTDRGPIRERDSAEIARLDAGAWFGQRFVGTRVPTLDAFLDAVAGKVELYVDAKDITPEALVDALRRRDLIDHSVVYQSAGYLARLRAVEPRLRRMPPLSDPSQIDALCDRVAPYAFDTRWAILSKALIDRCHAKGVKVFSDALGANESVEHYRRAILDGIDLIQTDHPVRVLRAVELLDASGRSARD